MLLFNFRFLSLALIFMVLKKTIISTCFYRNDLLGHKKYLGHKLNKKNFSLISNRALFDIGESVLGLLSWVPKIP